MVKSMTQPAYLIMAILVLAGAATAFQGPTNARLAVAVGSTVNAAFVSFVVGTIMLGLLALFLQVRPDIQAVRTLPWWGWMGGLYGCLFVASLAWGVPRLGVATTIVLAVSGQMIMGIILDHYGAFGAPTHPVSLTRIAGIALVIGGMLLVRRG